MSTYLRRWSWQWRGSEYVRCLEKQLAHSTHSALWPSKLNKIIRIKCLAQRLAHRIQFMLVNSCCHRHHRYHHHFFTWPTPCLKREAGKGAGGLLCTIPRQCFLLCWLHLHHSFCVILNKSLHFPQCGFPQVSLLHLSSALNLTLGTPSLWEL